MSSQDFVEKVLKFKDENILEGDLQLIGFALDLLIQLPSVNFVPLIPDKLKKFTKGEKV